MQGGLTSSNQVNSKSNSSFYAAWYRPDSVHQIEKDAFRELFTDSGLPVNQKYVELREYLINNYRQKPDAYLSVTTCRRNVSFDLPTLIKVHGFLEQWGLINNNTNSNFFANQDLLSKGFEKSFENGVLGSKCVNCSTSTSLIHASSVTTNEVFILCSECYKLPDIQKKLCLRTEEAFYEDAPHFPSGWLEKNIEGLLSAVEQYGDDWNAVSASVGRSREDCLCCFLCLTVKTSKLVSASHPELGYPFQFHDSVLLMAAELLSNNLDAFASSKIELKSLKSSNQSFPSSIFEFFKTSAKDTLDAERSKLVILHDQVVQAQLKKVSLKLKYLEELESTISNERKQIERDRLHLFMERYNLKKACSQNHIAS